MLAITFPLSRILRRSVPVDGVRIPGAEAYCIRSSDVLNGYVQWKDQLANVGACPPTIPPIVVERNVKYHTT